MPLISLDQICAPMQESGLGLRKLDVMNISSLISLSRKCRIASLFALIVEHDALIVVQDGLLDVVLLSITGLINAS